MLIVAMRAVFFFQAEDGIRDSSVTGVQTCALPIFVLHVAPEAAIGGPLALVKTGDRITLDVPARKLELLVSTDELAKRRKAWKAPPAQPGSDRGYSGLFHRTVLQADEGVDFDFLGPAKP